jgi:D-alanyl-D-alanine carboxypeptidase/D-alanyl-D-alanine-endopeptidase (penicillin-binding protein 4)
MLGAPAFANARWGVLIVRPTTGDTLYARDADRLFMPASNQKLLTGAAALALLGPDHTWRTALVARGPVREGVLQGDLAVVGRGDPTVSTAMRGDAMQPLRAMADSLAARGITRIAGRLVADGDAFPDAVLGYGWAWDDLDEPYSAGVDELFFNEGFGAWSCAAARSPATRPRCTSRRRPGALPLQAQVTTATPAWSAAPRRPASRPLGPARRRHVLEGVVSVERQRRAHARAPRPERGVPGRLGEALAARGIVVTSSVRRGAGEPAPTRTRCSSSLAPAARRAPRSSRSRRRTRSARSCSRRWGSSAPAPAPPTAGAA